VYSTQKSVVVSSAELGSLKITSFSAVGGRPEWSLAVPDVGGANISMHHVEGSLYLLSSTTLLKVSGGKLDWMVDNNLFVLLTSGLYPRSLLQKEEYTLLDLSQPNWLFNLSTKIMACYLIRMKSIWVQRYNLDSLPAHAFYSGLRIQTGTFLILLLLTPISCLLYRFLKQGEDDSSSYTFSPIFNENMDQFLATKGEVTWLAKLGGNSVVLVHQFESSTPKVFLYKDVNGHPTFANIYYNNGMVYPTNPGTTGNGSTCSYAIV
jgi:hypothetical protein